MTAANAADRDAEKTAGRKVGGSAWLGAAGLVSSLLILGFFTQLPALPAYLVSFCVAALLGYSGRCVHTGRKADAG